MNDLNRRASRILILAAAIVFGWTVPTHAETYPSCSRCTAQSGSEDACWSRSAPVLSTCGDEGVAAGLACAGPGETYTHAITKYVQKHALAGCGTAYATVNGLKARECTAATVVYSPTRRCAFGLSKSASSQANRIVILWKGLSDVDGVSYQVGLELGAPVSEPRSLKNASGGDAALYQIFERGGITLTPSWTPAQGARASWIGGQSDPALAALGAKWKQEPFILAGNAVHVSSGGFAATGFHDHKWPTTIYSDGQGAAKVGGTTDVRAALWSRWRDQGGFDGASDALGAPVLDEANGAQRFQNGALAVDGSNATPNAQLLGEPGSRESGLLYDAWQAATGVRAAAADTVSSAEGGGGYEVDNDFDGAAHGSFVIRQGAPAAHLVAGDTIDYWRSAQGAAGFLRWPTGDRKSVAGGTAQTFEGGNVYQQPGGRAYAVEGGPSSPFLAGYLAAGGPAGALGFPISDAPEPGNPVYTGMRVQRFQHGALSATTGTYSVPTYDDGVDPPRSFGIAEHTADTVTLRWEDTGAAFTILSRQVNQGAFVPITTMTRPAGVATFVDSAATAPPGPTVGALNCYRVRAADNAQQCGNGYTCEEAPVQCILLPLPGEAAISRAQVRIKVGTVEGADLDAPVQIRLGLGHNSWIDTPLDDLEAGSDVLFDLQTDGIKYATDIRALSVIVPGQDGLCIDELELFLNCSTSTFCPRDTGVFKKVFGPTSCAWSKFSLQPTNPETATVTIEANELRAPTPFGTWPQPFNTVLRGMTIDSLVSVADASTAQRFHGLEHNPRFVEGESTRAVVASESRLRLEQVIQVDCEKLCLWGTVTAHVAFDLVLVPGTAETRMRVENVNVVSSIEGFVDVFAPFWSASFKPLFEYGFSKVMEKGLQSDQGVGVPPPGSYFCFTNNGLGLCP